MPEETSRGRGPRRNAPLAVIVAFITAFVLYLTRSVVVPVIFAVFLTILIQPLVARLNRRLPYWLSLVIVLLGFTVAIAFAGVALVTSISNVGAALSEYSAKIEKVFSRVVEFAKARGLDLKQPKFGVEENISKVMAFVGVGLSSVFSILAQASVVVVLTVFALIEGRAFGEKIRSAFGRQRGGEILEVLEPMGQSIQQYLRTKTLVSLVTGTVAYIACLAIGIDFAFVWGTMVFLLNFLPYFGPVVAVIPAILVAFLQYDSPTRGIVAIFVLGVVQWLSGSVIEPQIMGRRLRVSVLFLLISMIFWGWFWGLAGVVLAIPLSSAAVIACAHIERLKPIAALLGAEPAGGEGRDETKAGGDEKDKKSEKPAAAEGPAQAG